MRTGDGTRNDGTEGPLAQDARHVGSDGNARSSRLNSLSRRTCGNDQRASGTGQGGYEGSGHGYDPEQDTKAHI